jgi:hypothetical protein
VQSVGKVYLKHTFLDVFPCFSYLIILFQSHSRLGALTCKLLPLQGEDYYPLDDETLANTIKQSTQQKGEERKGKKREDPSPSLKDNTQCESLT